MAMTKLTNPSKTSDSPVDYETINDVIAEMKEVYDAITAKHTTAGVHDDPILTSGWGKVTFSGSTPTLTTKNGIVDTLTDGGNGTIAINLTTTATTTDEMHASAIAHTNTGNFCVMCVATDTDTITFYIRDGASETLTDVDFSFSVWIQ